MVSKRNLLSMGLIFRWTMLNFRGFLITHLVVETEAGLPGLIPFLQQILSRADRGGNCQMLVLMSILLENWKPTAQYWISFYKRFLPQLTSLMFFFCTQIKPTPICLVHRSQVRSVVFFCLHVLGAETSIMEVVHPSEAGIGNDMNGNDKRWHDMDWNGIEWMNDWMKEWEQMSRADWGKWIHGNEWKEIKGNDMQGN